MVDLMDFIHRNISSLYFLDNNKIGHPLYLKNRRPDLWKLGFTCENTDTSVQYLTIVNEVLEAYLQKVVPGNVFEKLSLANTRVSFALPFNMPLEELRTYLSHFELTLHQVYKTLRNPKEKIWRARLNISKEEFQVITTPDPLGARLRFGRASNFLEMDVQEFVRRTAITREEVDELVETAFNPDIQNLKVEQKKIPQNCRILPKS